MWKKFDGISDENKTEATKGLLFSARLSLYLQKLGLAVASDFRVHGRNLQSV